ncbi:MAG: hypothetical protein P8Y80_03460 [Acidobacteriota bacterium]
MAQLLEQRRIQILDLLSATSPEPDQLRNITYENPYLSQVFLMRRDGYIVYPNPQDDITEDELAFLQNMQDILSYDNIVSQSSMDTPTPSFATTQQENSRSSLPATERNSARQSARSSTGCGCLRT